MSEHLSGLMPNEDIFASSSDLVRALDHFADEGEAIVVSSSFQTQSLPLLHMASQAKNPPTVAFLDTGYHFKETLEFRDHVVRLLNLDLYVLRGKTQTSGKDSSGNLPLFLSDPNRCCQVNKVEPMDALSEHFSLWVSGVRRDQTAVRAKLEPFEEWGANSRKWNPMLDWTAGMVDAYISHFSLPIHPLFNMGFASIGCAPCTSKAKSQDGNSTVSRIGRWGNIEKTECGLHLPRNS